jgi:hypothetical protein
MNTVQTDTDNTNLMLLVQVYVPIQPQPKNIGFTVTLINVTNGEKIEPVTKCNLYDILQLYGSVQSRSENILHVTCIKIK